jgi:hypothetical protein
VAGNGWIRRVSRVGECLFSVTSRVGGDIFSEGEEVLEDAAELAGEAEFLAAEMVEGAGVASNGVVGSRGALDVRAWIGLMADFGGEAGCFHGEEAALTPATGGEVFDEAFFEGCGRLKVMAEAGEEGGEAGAFFSFYDDGFGELAVGGAVTALRFGAVLAGGFLLGWGAWFVHAESMRHRVEWVLVSSLE